MTMQINAFCCIIHGGYKINNGFTGIWMIPCDHNIMRQYTSIRIIDGGHQAIQILLLELRNDKNSRTNPYSLNSLTE